MSRPALRRTSPGLVRTRTCYLALYLMGRRMSTWRRRVIRELRADREVRAGDGAVVWGDSSDAEGDTLPLAGAGLALRSRGGGRCWVFGVGPPDAVLVGAGFVILPLSANGSPRLHPAGDHRALLPVWAGSRIRRCVATSLPHTLPRKPPQNARG